MNESLPKKIFQGFLLGIVGLLSPAAVVSISAQSTQQQEATETSKPQILLLDENEEPIAGVKAVNLTTSKEAVSDASGLLTLATSKGDVVQLSAFGSKLQDYIASNQERPVVVLSSKHPSIVRLKPVRLLNNTSVRSDLTAASTQAVYNNDLKKMPVASFVNALPGRLAGFFTTQASGQPGVDGPTTFLRGQAPLVIIDGIPRNLTVFDLEEIESVTILKDAVSTAMLGVRSSNGVLLVTTRKGSPSQPRISFTAQSAIQQPLRQPKALNSYNYARLYNEALVNDGLPPVYSETDLQGYQSGSDPYRYPDVDWRKQVLKPSSRFDRYTFSASGGNNFSKYFVAVEHINQTGLLRESNINKYNTNNDFKSYTIRSNVDLQLNSKLSGGIHLLGRILSANDAGAAAGTGSILASLLNTPSNAYPVYNPNGSFGGSQQFQNNIWAQTIGSGYRQNYKRDMLADFYLKRTLDELTPGLWVRATGSYYATLSENINRNKSFAVFQRNLSATGQETYQQFGTNGDQANGNGIVYQSRADYMELALGYDRTIGAHGFNAIVLGNRDNTVADSDLPYTITGASGRASYNYQEKYVVEAAVGINGSNRYPEGGRTKYGVFPALGLAWNISREDFLKSYSWLSYLKLFGSVGKTGNDNPGYFTYIQRYFDSPSVFFGTGAGSNTAITEQPIANRNLTWEKANKLNLGLQGAVLNNRLGFTLEYYNMKYYDLLMQRGRNTTILGNTYPSENIGQNRYMGWDFQLSWQQDKPGFSYFVAANVGIQDSKVLYSDEVFRMYPWMTRTGQMVNQRFGYVAEGLFQSADEIGRSATIIGYTPQPGDIKYRDLNGDGIINQFDEAPIGNQKPLIPFGLNMGLRWHSFDLSVLLQGALNQNIYLQGNSEWAFQNNGFGPAFEQHLDRWTPTNTTASYPRLNVGNNVNNMEMSSFWARSGDYLRVKNLELGYTIPVRVINRVRLQSVRLFASGTNLLTFNQEKRIDPEAYNGAYPIQRLFNFGVNLKL
ncbi:SusC/RagA family TonB-linked outer membrane protein [Tellurirhabdus bombi]|uniref:SusC/RagA family TonB-linked outer membrane protein n=1 Tax=Tellurirhabdus bombi TaxID=2907205 RepID=UPI001F4446BB|nr:SusC/RagA family TonB-linked outer membrane protein [Tellurirhabdus bombi]